MTEPKAPDFQAQFVERPSTPRGYRDPAHPHRWLRYPAGGPGWRICKWCALTQNPEEVQRPRPPIAIAVAPAAGAASTADDQGAAKSSVVS